MCKFDDLEPRFRAHVERFLSSIDDRDLRAVNEETVDGLIAEGVRSHADLYQLIDPHTPEKVLTSACWLVGRVGHRRSATSRLLEVAQHSGSSDVRVVAVYSLGMIGGSRARRALIELLKSDHDGTIRAAAAAALPLVGHKEVTDALMGALRNRREDDDVRAQAASSLGLVGGKRAASALAEAAFDTSDQVRFFAVSSLGNTGEREAMALLDKVAREDTAVLPWWGSLAQAAAQAKDRIAQRLVLEEARRN